MDRLDSPYLPLFSVAVVSLFLLAASSFMLSASSSSPRHRTPATEDSSRAQLNIQREGETLQVQGEFVNQARNRDTLTYTLTVQRSGRNGTTESTQSGTFETAPGQTNTLSSVQVNVQSGDQVTLRLIVGAEGQLIDETQAERTIP